MSNTKVAKTEKGVIIVAYKEMRRNQRFLVLKRTKNWEGWELPKGHLEEDDYEKTVEIELSEEAGIKENRIEKVTDMEETVSWSYERDGDKYEKEYKAYLVKLDQNATVDTSNNPDEEHSQGFFLNKEDAESLLNYDNNVQILNKGSNQI